MITISIAKDLRLHDWINLLKTAFADLAENNRSRILTDKCAELVSSMEEEEVEQFEDELRTEYNRDVNEYPQSSDCYFSAGFYSRIRNLACWTQKREEEAWLDPEDHQ